MNIALITSTIAPSSGVMALQRTNVTERLGDYEVAFDHYCAALKDGVFDQMVYVDNSGHDISSLEAVARTHGVSHLVEFISYVSSTPPGNNRLFLELNLIDHFVDASKFLASHPKAKVWKITGRYLIRNIADIVSACARAPGDLHINFRNHPYKVVDFYLVGFTLKAYKQLFRQQIHKFEGAVDGEIILRQLLDSTPATALAMSRRLPVTPRILGVRGFDGARYGGAKDNVKYLVRAFASRFLPALWI